MTTLTDVFVVAPGRTVTGGPHLCHQLVHQLNCDTPGRAAIVYAPFDRKFQTPAAYQHYGVPIASHGDITPGAIVVLPEVYGYIVDQFPDNDVYFWWLSVNFLAVSARHQGQRVDEQMPRIARHAARHLYQSEYARLFLEKNRLGPVSRLSDKLSDNYLSAIEQPCTDLRDNLIVFNPAKGWDRTKMLLAALNKGVRTAPKMVPILNMTPTQVELALEAAKVYVDFGPHPGKDRLPREAAAMGCAVVTNRRGAANNDVDVPIPAEFKLDDLKPRWKWRAAAKINAVMADYEPYPARFDEYRQIIAGEPAQFVADVRALFPVKVALC